MGTLCTTVAIFLKSKTVLKSNEGNTVPPIRNPSTLPCFPLSSGRKFDNLPLFFKDICQRLIQATS